MAAGPGAAADALQARALRWLARREHSRSEMRAKLLRAAGAMAGGIGGRDAEDMGNDGMGHGGTALDPADVDVLLERLQQQGLLSDERFVQSRLRLRGPQHGLRRLEAELARHAVALPAADRLHLLATELPRAVDLWRRRFGGPAADPKLRARQMRFLAARGFSTEVIRKAAAELRRAADSDSG